MDTFVHSSFGTVVMTLFQGILTAPSWHTFTSLACGWALASDRRTMTTYVWRTGATTVKHFARFSGFLGCPLDPPDAGNSGALSSAWRHSLSPRARSCGSSATLPPRKKPGAISKDSTVIAMALAQHGQHSARCGACTACGASCPCPSHGGPATASASRLGLHSPSPPPRHRPQRAGSFQKSVGP